MASNPAQQLFDEIVAASQENTMQSALEQQNEFIASLDYVRKQLRELPSQIASLQRNLNEAQYAIEESYPQCLEGETARLRRKKDEIAVQLQYARDTLCTVIAEQRILTALIENT